MFICEKCLNKNYENFGIPRSYGPCEDCGYTKHCVDIQSSKLIPKKKESEKDFKEFKINEISN